MTKQDIIKLVDEFAAKLAEHCDSVQIMCEVTEDGQSAGIYRGRGSWYARQAMAEEFREMNKAGEHARQIADALAPEVPPDTEVY